jgi:hypothetical protein
MRRLFATVLALVCAAAAVPAQVPVTVNGNPAGQGDRVQITYPWQLGPAQFPVHVRTSNGSYDQTFVLTAVHAVEPFSLDLLPLTRGERVIVAIRIAWEVAQEVRVVCSAMCFPAGTPIVTPTGPIPIETAKAGDEVIEPVHGRRVRIEQVATSHALALLELVSQRGILQTTPGHPFLTRDSGWVAARDLRAGDALLGEDGVVVLEKVVARKVTTPVPVFSLVLASGESFMVGEARCVVAAQPPAPMPAIGAP